MSAIDPAAFGLTLQPMVHVAAMGPAIDFYAALGGRLVFGSRDGDWALIVFETSALSLLARPSGEADGARIELHFTARASLDTVAAHVAAVAPDAIDRGVADEAFGRMLRLRTPDGLVVKVIEVDRDVIG